MDYRVRHPNIDFECLIEPLSINQKKLVLNIYKMYRYIKNIEKIYIDLENQVVKKYYCEIIENFNHDLEDLNISYDDKIKSVLVNHHSNEFNKFKNLQLYLVQYFFNIFKNIDLTIYLLKDDEKSKDIISEYNRVFGNGDRSGIYDEINDSEILIELFEDNLLSIACAFCKYKNLIIDYQNNNTTNLDYFELGNINYELSTIDFNKIKDKIYAVFIKGLDDNSNVCIVDTFTKEEYNKLNGLLDDNKGYEIVRNKERDEVIDNNIETTD